MINLPRLQILAEARQPDLKYSDKRVKGALEKVTLELQGNNSGAMTRLTKRYERLDRSAKLLTEKRNEVNAQIKNVGDQLFDAEDSIATRIIETISCTIMLTAAQKAADKAPSKKIDFESAYAELAKLVPELQEKVDMITAKYTEIIAAKDTPTALRVKLKEGILDTLKSWIKGFISEIKSWGTSYDAKLAKIKALLK